MHVKTHDRAFVRRLHEAYADKIDSFFSGLRNVPGDPYRVQLRRFGDTRTGCANGHDWLNRATLIGDESAERLDEIIAHFASYGRPCLVEWNPGNCYRPGSWKEDLFRLLSERNFVPGGFRCVWVKDLSTPLDPLGTSISIKRFEKGELDAYAAAVAALEHQSPEQAEEARINFVYGNAHAGWHHYVASIDGIPCGNTVMFITGSTAYFEWARSDDPYRGRGVHTAMIRRRLADAREAGCDLAFAVTDIGIPSARNLQREGFELAYNYVMLRRDRC